LHIMNQSFSIFLLKQIDFIYKNNVYEI